jgi:uncharacterized LabA/DUF88 family protein
MNKSLCRIGVFYDGSFFTYAQHYFYGGRKLGWLSYTPFHALIENHIREKEQGYSSYRVVYAAWFQGLFTTGQSNDQQRRKDRNRDLDLMHAGIEPRYVPMSQAGEEKGIDVALAVDAMQVGLQRTIDIAALVTGDGDFVPLTRALMKHGVPVTAVYFEYHDEHGKSFINDRLLNACNYSLNVNSLERDRKYQSLFRGLFRSAEPTHDTAKPVVPAGGGA